MRHRFLRQSENRISLLVFSLFYFHQKQIFNGLCFESKVFSYEYFITFLESNWRPSYFSFNYSKKYSKYYFYYVDLFQNTGNSEHYFKKPYFTIDGQTQFKFMLTMQCYLHLKYLSSLTVWLCILNLCNLFNVYYLHFIIAH